MGISLTGFYWVAAGDWRRLLLCLFGFILARLLIIQVTGFNSASPPTGNSHAS
jgi:F1F0 ATPase subunit 2